MKKLILLALTLATLAAVRPPRETDLRVIRLTWDVTDPTATPTGYKLYHGTSPTIYEAAIEIPPAAQTAQFNPPGPGTYYFQLTAVFADGTESLPTNQVEVKVNPIQSAVGNLKSQVITIFID